MNAARNQPAEDVIQLQNADARSRFVLVCEHASHFIPEKFDNLGLSQEHRTSHAAWDPGALAVAERLSLALDAKLVSSRISRLVYDCNRPPEAPDAMPIRSEVVDVPGNVGLDATAKADRVKTYYEPFRTTLAQTIKQTPAPIIVTLHSFTPVYFGQHRAVEIGVLHDADARLANAMLDLAPDHTGLDVRRNEPYGPEHGVTHTLKDHALPGGHPNVMLEIRNDLVATATQQAEIASQLAGWLTAAQSLYEQKEPAA